MRQNGYRETSLDDLAREVHVTKPALYHYVSSKEALLYEIYERTIEEWIGAIQAIKHNPNWSAPQKIHEVVRRFMHLCIERDEMAVFFSEKLYLADDHFQNISEKERQVIAVIASIIEEGVKEGTMRPMEPKAVTFAIVGMTAWTYRWFQQDGPMTIDELADMYYDLLWRGMAADSKGGGFDGVQ